MGHTRPAIELGSFVVGEVPKSLEYQFLDVDGVPLNLTGYTVARFQWGGYAASGAFVDPVDEAATISDATAGKVRYTWDGDEFETTGPHAGQFFVNNGSNQYASLLITWQVCASVTTPPTV